MEQVSFYYGEALRLDWGLGNPNRTAALIACLMVACWMFSRIRRWGFPVALATSFALGLCLVQTYSRGGLLAFLAGSLPLLWFADRPWPRKRVLAVLVATLLIVGYAVSSQATGRYASSWQGDASVGNRLALWSSVPAMMVDAPNGWGFNNGQNAYLQWYQPQERTERFQNMVSVHLTAMTDLGWPLRFGYLLLWIVAFWLTFPGKTLSIFAPTFGVCLATFVAGIFTHFAEAWILYVPALLSVGYAIAIRISRRQWPRFSPLALATCGAGILLVLTYVVGTATPHESLRSIPHGVVLGKGAPNAWILVDRSVLGQNFGKSLRKALSSSPTKPCLGVVEDIQAIPTGSTVVLCGTSATFEALKTLRPKKVILLNPHLTPEEQKTAPVEDAMVVIGEFARIPTRSSWREGATIIPGMGEFLPEWPEIVLQGLPRH